MDKDTFDFDALLASTLDCGALADTPIRILADLYLSDCEAANLQPGTMEFYRCRIRYLVESLGDRIPSVISTVHLRALLSHLKERREWSVQNVNHCVQVWKGFFNYLEREGIIEFNPTRRLEKLRQESRFPIPFTAAQVAALLQAASADFCGTMDKAMMLVLLDTGLRARELLGLSMDDVDVAGGVLRVFGKGRKERFVPFEATVRRALLRYIAVRAAKLKKTRGDGNSLWLTIDGRPLDYQGFRFRLIKHSANATINDVHPHLFRHTFATEYLRHGGSPQMLQRILVHTTPMMTQRYVHVADPDAKENHRKSSPVESWAIHEGPRSTRQRRGMDGRRR